MSPINPDTYVFDFGQYNGYNYREVLSMDAQYIHWCYFSGVIELDDEALTELEEKLRC